MNEKDWIDITTALATPVIALFGIIIAILQVTINKNQARINKNQESINRNRLKHELFDRRYKMFEATRDFLGSIGNASGFEIKKEAIFEYQISIRGAAFVFNKKTAKYMKNICKKVIELRKHQKENDSEKEHELLTWLDQEFYKVEDNFMEEMSLYFK